MIRAERPTGKAIRIPYIPPTIRPIITARVARVIKVRGENKIRGERVTDVSRIGMCKVRFIIHGLHRVFHVVVIDTNANAHVEFVAVVVTEAQVLAEVEVIGEIFPFIQYIDIPVVTDAGIRIKVPPFQSLDRETEIEGAIDIKGAADIDRCGVLDATGQKGDRVRDFILRIAERDKRKQVAETDDIEKIVAKIEII